MQSRTMRTFLSFSSNKLSQKGQLKYQMRIIALLLLSFVSLHAQTLPETRRQACNLSRPMNKNDLTCSCSIQYINCNSKRLTAVPFDFVKETHYLDLSENSITEIEKNDFQGLEFLKKLNLYYNPIKCIHPYAFRNMYRLNSLHLTNNRLTKLDSSGVIFQHLPSLDTLSLAFDQITELKKDLLFTTVASNKTVEIDFNKNPIKCDCDVWAIRSWVKDLPANKIVISNLKCANDPNGRFYENADKTVFGQCDAHNKVLVSDLECKICNGARTNWGCQQKMEKLPCSDNQMVCQKTVTWDEATRVMFVSSSCASYASCLEKERNNSNTCGINYQVNRNVTCNFCFPHSDSPYSDEAGFLKAERTTDFIFFMNYTKPNESLFLQKAPEIEKDRISAGIRSCILTLKGGVDVEVTQIREWKGGTYISLNMYVTTFSTEKYEAVLANITNDLRNTQSSFLRDEGAINYESIILSSPHTGEDTSTCPRMNTTEIDPLFYVDLSEENALNVSIMLTNYTKDINNRPSIELNNTVERLLQFTNETLLKDPQVVTEVLFSLSNFMNIDEQNLMELENMNPVSERLLDMIEFISEKAPLSEGQLNNRTSNLVIMALEVNISQPKDVELTVDSDTTGKFNHSTVNFGNFSENASQKKGGRSSMVVPLIAILESLNRTEEMNISRVSFAVHQSDILFRAMKNKSNEIPPTNTTFICKCQNKESCDCHGQNVSRWINKINSHIISAKVQGIIVQNLSKNITMTFAHAHTYIDSKNHRCVFWDHNSSNGTGDWSDEGCSLIEFNTGQTTCTCNHLTNFALLMDVYQVGSTLSPLHHKILSIISYVGCGISVFALILTIIIYILLRKMNDAKKTAEKKDRITKKVKSDPRKPRKQKSEKASIILTHLCVALLLSNLTFLVGMHNYTFDNTASCKVVAVLMHYFLLVSLTWMAVEAFYMYLTLIKVFSTYIAHLIIKCSVVAWGVPLMIIVITLGINTTENYGFINSGLCWLKNPAFYAAFVLPVIFILLINCIVFGLLIRQLCVMNDEKLRKTDRTSIIQQLQGLIGVVFLLGLTWLFAILAIDQASVVLYYCFAVFNSFQGLFIFVFFYLLKKDVIITWKNILPCLEKNGKSFYNIQAVTAKTNAHHLINKTESSQSDFSTTTVTTTIFDSSQDSYFNYVNMSNSDDTSE